MKTTIVLVGYMGAGKSTVAKLLAEKLAMPIVDLDKKIEESAQLSIPTIFAKQGEAAFRKLESRVLQESLQQTGIIATGGGVVLSKTNRDLLKDAWVVFLDCQDDVLVKRIFGDKQNIRPVVQNKTAEQIKEIYQVRKPFYDEVASLTIDTSRLTVDEVVQQIIQAQQTIGYLGPVNSFSFQALKQVVDHQKVVEFASIPLCIDALLKEKLDFALVPIENSLEGSVHASVDRLYEQKECYVQAEIVLPIHQQLIGYDAKQIKKILSHPQALAQCQKYIEEHFPCAFLEPVQSTTAAVLEIAQRKDKSLAAIAGKQAAEFYQVPILASNIQDNDFNQTRFWILGKKHFDTSRLTTSEQKLTLYITLPKDSPGALHKVLAAFAWRDLNLVKIESRPQKTKLGEYFFIVDLQVNRPHILYQNAIEELEALGCVVQNLGMYPVLHHS